MRRLRCLGKLMLLVCVIASSSMAEPFTKQETRNMNLPPEHIIAPKEKIAAFSGAKWPYNNVEPAVYAALGLLYARTEKRYADGALIHDDMEYSIHNVLSGHAAGMFYCWPDDSLNMALYGFTSRHLKRDDVSEDEIKRLIQEQIARGNAVHIDEGNSPFDYLIWGYRDNGNVLLGCQFQHGNDDLNYSFDFENPAAFDDWAKKLFDPALFKPNGEKSGGITIYQPDGERLDRNAVYRKGLALMLRMLTQTEPPPAMDAERVHFGYGQAIYDAWIFQLEKANAENSDTFYYASPVFPHFIALYENRLHLHKFLKLYADMCGDENLRKAVELSGRLIDIDIAIQAMRIIFDNQNSTPELLALSNNERRVLLIDILKQCRALELEIAAVFRAVLDAPEARDTGKPLILQEDE